MKKVLMKAEISVNDDGKRSVTLSTTSGSSLMGTLTGSFEKDEELDLEDGEIYECDFSEETEESDEEESEDTKA